MKETLAALARLVTVGTKILMEEQQAAPELVPDPDVDEVVAALNQLSVALGNWSALTPE